MQLGIFSYALLGALAIALLIAAVTDWRRRQIDNLLNAANAICAPLFWLTSGMTLVDIGFQVALALVTFIVLAALFAAGQMGGGDVKLLTALALWIHPLWFSRLIVIMALAGGLLTIALWVWKKWRKDGGALAVPYGIAISFGGLWVLADQYIANFGQSGISG